MINKLKQFGSGLFIGATILSIVSAFMILHNVSDGKYLTHTKEGKAIVVYAK